MENITENAVMALVLSLLVSFIPVINPRWGWIKKSLFCCFSFCFFLAIMTWCDSWEKLSSRNESVQAIAAPEQDMKAFHLERYLSHQPCAKETAWWWDILDIDQHDPMKMEIHLEKYKAILKKNLPPTEETKDWNEYYRKIVRPALYEHWITQYFPPMK